MLYYPFDSKVNRNIFDEKNENYLHVWFIRQHMNKESYSQIDSIIHLYNSGKSCLLPIKHYFNNVKHLEVDHLNSSSFQWMIKHIDLSTITELIITNSDHDLHIIRLLIESTVCTNSLKIHYKQLVKLQQILPTKNKSLKRLDISIIRHSFEKKDIRIIANLFPSTEHLKINSTKLDYLPILAIYSVYLRSLTFKFFYFSKSFIRNFPK